jgi:hypothetical protein
VFSALFEVFVEVQNLPCLFTVEEYSEDAVRFCRSDPTSHFGGKNIFEMTC